MKKFSGVIPPVITAFDKEGRFDESAQRDIIKFLKSKVNGFYPVGTYGSGPLMDVEERKKVAEVIVDEVNGDVPVMIHIGSASTAQAVDLARHAESIGADAVGAIPPYYYKKNLGFLLHHQHVRAHIHHAHKRARGNGLPLRNGVDFHKTFLQRQIDLALPFSVRGNGNIDARRQAQRVPQGDVTAVCKAQRKLYQLCDAEHGKRAKHKTNKHGKPAGHARIVRNDRRPAEYGQERDDAFERKEP
jgi:hypothetical protein